MSKVKIIITNGHRDLNSCAFRAVNEARYIKEKGFDTELIILQNKETGRKVISNSIDGIEAKHFICRSEKADRLLSSNKIAKKFRTFIYLKWYIEFVLWMRKYFKNEGADYLQCHNLTSVLAGFMASKKSVLIFVMRENYEFQAGVKGIKKIAIKKINSIMQNKSDWLVHVTKDQLKLTAQKNKTKVLLIPNYSSEKQYTNIEKTNFDKLRINYIGSARDYDSIKMLMDACKDMDDVCIRIAGMGEAYEKLKKIEHNYFNVQITGYYDYKTETERLYQNTDIIYCAYNIDIKNWKESRPIKFYEAMITQTPVISCYEMNLSELILKYDIGFLFHYKNPQSLKNLIRHIADNPREIEKKAANIKKIKNQFTWEHAVKLLDEIYVKT